MLTSDLVRATRRADRLHLRFLKEPDQERLLPCASALVATYRSMVGASRAELEEATRALPHAARDRAVVQGLIKLCDDRTELSQASEHDPPKLREVVFRLAAEAHRAGTRFDRVAVLSRAGAELGLDEAAIEGSLFGDLRDAEIVQRFDPIEPTALLARYDVALAQAALLRATRVTLRFDRQAPREVRALFRAARFFGLLCSVTQRGDGFEIVFDGPFSLFDRVQKYGINLAMFLPRVLALPEFELSAELFWGKRRDRVELSLSHKSGLKSEREATLGERPELEQLRAAFESFETHWRLEACDKLLVAPDGSVVVPDLAFESARTGEVVFLELFGFYSKEALLRRVAQVRAGLSARVILVVPKQARVGEAVLDADDHESSVLVYKTAISAREVLRRLDRGA